MIFGRKKRAQAAEDEGSVESSGVEPAAAADPSDAVDAPRGDAVGAADDDTPPDDAPDDANDPDVGDELDTATLDGIEWRTAGPFEVSELSADEDEDEDEQPRIDLGSIVVTPVPGSELRLQVNESSDIVSAMLVLPITAPATNGAQPEVVGSSALELSAYAAPRSGGLWAELRDEISEAAAEVGGSAELAAGPFGVELRRLLPVTTPEGEQGYQPSRMWVAEGPRWLLRGIVYGQAAIERDDDDPAVAAVLGAFREIVVRRGDEAMAPGDLLPMSMPADLQPAE